MVTVAAEEAEKAYAETWWLALHNGRMDGAERKLLALQRQAFKLQDQDSRLPNVVAVLNSKFREAKEGMFMPVPKWKEAWLFKPVLWVRDQICWDFEVVADDLVMAETEFKGVKPGFVSMVLAWIWQLLLHRQDHGVTERFELLCRVFVHCIFKAIHDDSQDAWTDFRAWFFSARTTYLTILGFLGIDIVKGIFYIADAVILVSMWNARGDKWRMAFEAVLWLLSAFVHYLLRSWKVAMQPRMPFLHARLEKKYMMWREQVKSK